MFGAIAKVSGYPGYVHGFKSRQSLYTIILKGTIIYKPSSFKWDQYWIMTFFQMQYLNFFRYPTVISAVKERLIILQSVILCVRVHVSFSSYLRANYLRCSTRLKWEWNNLRCDIFIMWMSMFPIDWLFLFLIYTQTLYQAVKEWVWVEVLGSKCAWQN